MRVIHIVHGRANPAGHNGISRVVYHLNKHEKALGLNSEIWAVTDDAKSHYTHKRDKYVTIECFPRVRFPFLRNQIIDRLIAEKDSIDLVHFHMIWFLDKNIIARALVNARIPFVITTHGTYTKRHAYKGKRKVARWLYELRYLQLAKEIRVISREEGTGLQRYGCTTSVFFVPHGIDMSEVEPTVTRRVATDGRMRGIWVGVLRDDKNLHALFHAVAMLDPSVRGQLRIEIAGPDYKGNMEKYRTLCRSLGVQDCFEFTGPKYRSEKFDAIVNADFYVMPSHSEAMSLALLEGFACGRPALLTSGCGWNYFAKRDFFVTCEPYAQDIALGLTELFERRADWPAMGQRALQTVRDELSWPAAARAMSANYERIVSQCR